MNKTIYATKYTSLFFVFTFSSLLLGMETQEIEPPHRQTKNYNELHRQRICVNTDGRPEKLVIMSTIQNLQLRRKGKLAQAEHRRFIKQLKEAQNSDGLRHATHLITHIEKQNKAFYESLFSRLSDEYNSLPHPLSPLFVPDLIPEDDIAQRRYFYQSLLTQIELEIDMCGEALQKKQEDFLSLLIRYITNIWNAKTSLTLAKAYLDGRVGEPVEAATQPITHEQYDALDGTDKVLYAHFLGKAEYDLEIAETIGALFATVQRHVENELLEKIVQWKNQTVQELHYLKIPDLEERVRVVIPSDNQTTCVDGTEGAVANKKRRNRKRKKPSPATLAMIQEAQRSLNDKMIEEQNQQRKVSPKAPTSPATPVVNSDQESLSAWWVRTSKDVSMRRVIQESILDSEKRQSRKANAKRAKNHEDKRTHNVASDENEQPVIEPAQKLSIGNYFWIFEAIMGETYNGEMAPVLTMIQNGLNGNVIQGSGSRLRLGLRNFATRGLERLELFMATEMSYDAEAVVDSKMVIHVPHKRKSKRLRPEHVKSIKTFLEAAGYSLETVCK